MFWVQFCLANFALFKMSFEILYISQDNILSRYRVDPKIWLRGGLQVLLDKYSPLEQNKGIERLEMILILGQLSIVCKKNAGLGKTGFHGNFSMRMRMYGISI